MKIPRIPPGGTKVEEIKCTRCGKLLLEAYSCKEVDCPHKIKEDKEKKNDKNP